MENNYSFNSYAESGESSPRSRDVDFDNLQPWEDPSATNNYKVKFMCSYGGKIHPRPHDNQLSYVGGETKILAFDRLVKFAAVNSKLTALCDGEVCIKYQLPGEDLDALISVTNDEDLEHMMHEYDRLNRASTTPARLRLFLFPVNGRSPALTPVHSFGSIEEKSDRGRFVDALNSGLQTTTPPSVPATNGNREIVLGSEKELLQQHPSEMASRTRDHHIADPQSFPHVQGNEVVDERAIESDRIQKHIQDLQRLRIAEDQQPSLYRRPSDDNLASRNPAEYHVPRMIENAAPTTLPVTVTAPANGYQMSGGSTVPTILSDQQHVYMIQTPSGMYHAPMARPVTTPVNQTHGYYVQRMPTEVYRDQPVYNVTAQHAQSVTTPQATQQQILQQKVATYTEGYRMVQSTTPVADSGYAQVAYDNVTGRQYYYTPQGAVVAASQQPQQSPQPMQSAAQQYQPLSVTAAIALNQESGTGGKVVQANMKEFI